MTVTATSSKQTLAAVLPTGRRWLSGGTPQAVPHAATDGVPAEPWVPLPVHPPRRFQWALQAGALLMAAACVAFLRTTRQVVHKRLLPVWLEDGERIAMAGGYSRKWWSKESSKGAVVVAEPAGAAASFPVLGVGPPLCAALARCGYATPTAIQSASYAVQRAGGDAVLAGETGIGKTLAYLVPALDRLLATGAGRTLVLHPNRDLCQQMAEVARRVLAQYPEPHDVRLWSLVEDGPEDWQAKLVVGTPSAALKHWPQLSKLPVDVVVLDEADTLLAGSFKVARRNQYPIEQLLLELRRSAQARGSRPIRAGPSDTPSDEPPTPRDADEEADPRDEDEKEDEAWPEDEDQPENSSSAESPSVAPAPAPLNGRTQHVFCGATVPNFGERNVSNLIQKRWPRATWVQSPNLHRPLERLEHRFVFAPDAEARRQALLRAVAHDLPAEGLPQRTLVFANSIATVNAAHAILQDAGYAAELFHKEVEPAEREARLAQFKAGTLPILVCSGLASRGIDFPLVGHVVQYEFAGNSVEHLHRVGRTARAGAKGLGTTLYGPTEAPLVDSMERADGEGRAVEHTFSRRRSF
eukprot:EG_transcript_7807